ncbi:hypothetical protein AN237_24870 (plasmid) [Raoultella ornithinolytica]|uniref:hypothetical protein n=1 Tax=Raoultella ornithinolytica TaxID=54291 RepID=UPI00084A1367|nr:hypothetical protein [Raoultella ornithinolytica]AOO59797.1 hypothetical protein AN237_24870 [Raoultella ornithinolytica]
MSTVVDAGDDAPAAGRSKGKCLLWSMPVMTPGQLAAAGEMSTVVDEGKMSTVVDAGTALRQLAAAGENVYCS